MPRKHIKVELDLYVDVYRRYKLADLIDELECDVEFKADDIELRHFVIADAWEEDE